MTKVNGYQGWANWETWNVALWLNNDERLYSDYRSVARHQRFTAATVELYVKAVMPNGTPDFADCGGRAAYARVDWREIAEDFNDGLEG